MRYFNMATRRLLAIAGITGVGSLFVDRRFKANNVAHMEGTKSQTGDLKIQSPAFGAVNTRSGPKTFKAVDPEVTLDTLVLLTGSAHPKLAEKISKEVKVPLANAGLTRFSDGEVSVQIQENVRGKNVFVIQTCAAPVNDSIMELLLTISCLRRADARRVIAVVPYFGYKHHRRGYPLSTKHSSRFLSSGAADFATMLQELGVDRVIAVDLQRPGQGHEACFFDNFVPVETYITTELFVEHLLQNHILKHPITVVAPNAECFKKAKNVQNLLHKETKTVVKFLPFFAADDSSGPSNAKELTTLSSTEVRYAHFSVYILCTI
ncbi:ribose-phosphate pyrophosphokinase [archaeon]|nr:MAG: ribose-phosphate pyrophosphokinase [archaeon]